jgi:3' terminal RNA ribose 2'-O-methyltransferase Hen1
MLLTITTTQPPATDLGFLLHKSPFTADGVHTLSLSHGQAHVFYPEASESRCTAALLVELDPVGLVRGRGPEGEGAPLLQYVNDRPYAASSFLAVAIGHAFSTALSGRSKERPELAARAIPLEARVSAVPCRGEGGAAMARAFFEPLGYAVELEQGPLDPRFPAWGTSPYATITLRGTVRLADMLSHLVVLIPALDGETHYWVGEDEVEKLLRRGEGWLASHPAKEPITARYLRHQRRLAELALSRLVDEESVETEPERTRDEEEQQLEKPLRLAERRVEAVLEVVRASGLRSLVDLGCGQARFVRAAMKEKQLDRIVGVDVSSRALEVAEARLERRATSEADEARVQLLLGSVLYRDARLDGIDVATCIEVIEHLDPDRLPFFVENVFGAMRPKLVVLTTPNVEANAKMPGLPAGAMRHRDHRFEWTRAEFSDWCVEIGKRRGYDVRFAPIGDDDPMVGAPTQMAVLTRREQTGAR